jgi:hypothetical protein
MGTEFNNLVIVFLVAICIGTLFLLIMNIKVIEWKRRFGSNLLQIRILYKEFLSCRDSGDQFLSKYSSEEPYHDLYNSFQNELKILSTLIHDLDKKCREFEGDQIKLKGILIYDALIELIIEPFYWQDKQQQSGKVLGLYQTTLKEKWDLINIIQKKIDRVKIDTHLRCRKLIDTIKQTEQVHQKLQANGLKGSSFDVVIKRRQEFSHELSKINQCLSVSLQSKNEPFEVVKAYNILEKLDNECELIFKQATNWDSKITAIKSEILKLCELIATIYRLMNEFIAVIDWERLDDEYKRLKQKSDQMVNFPDQIDVDRLETINVDFVQFNKDANRLVISIQKIGENYSILRSTILQNEKRRDDIYRLMDALAREKTYPIRGDLFKPRWDEMIPLFDLVGKIEQKRKACNIESDLAKAQKIHTEFLDKFEENYHHINEIRTAIITKRASLGEESKQNWLERASILKGAINFNLNNWGEDEVFIKGMPQEARDIELHLQALLAESSRNVILESQIQNQYNNINKLEHEVLTFKNRFKRVENRFEELKEIEEKVKAQYRGGVDVLNNLQSVQLPFLGNDIINRLHDLERRSKIIDRELANRNEGLMDDKEKRVDRWFTDLSGYVSALKKSILDEVQKKKNELNPLINKILGIVNVNSDPEVMDWTETVKLVYAHTFKVDQVQKTSIDDTVKQISDEAVNLQSIQNMISNANRRWEEVNKLKLKMDLSRSLTKEKRKILKELAATNLPTRENLLGLENRYKLLESRWEKIIKEAAHFDEKENELMMLDRDYLHLVESYKEKIERVRKDQSDIEKLIQNIVSFRKAIHVQLDNGLINDKEVIRTAQECLVKISGEQLKTIGLRYKQISSSPQAYEEAYQTYKELVILAQETSKNLSRPIIHINTPPSTMNTTIGGDFKGNFIAGSPHATIINGDDNSRKGLDINDLQKLFEIFYKSTNSLPLETRKDTKADLDKIKAELSKGNKMDEGFIQERLKNIKKMAPDIIQVMFKAVESPTAGMVEVFKKILFKAFQ